MPVLLCIFEKKTLVYACGQICQIFGIGLIKIYLIGGMLHAHFKIRTKIGITVPAREICIQGGTSHYQGGTSHDQGGTSHGHQPDRARGDGDCPPMGGRGHRGRRGWGGRGAHWREGPPSGWMPSRRPGGGHYRW